MRTVSDGLQANAWVHDIEGMLGVHEIDQYIWLWHAVEHITLTMEPDRLLRKWTTSGSYSAKSCYKATFQRSIHSES